MPELPEVETVRRGLEQQTAGFQIEGVEVLRARTIAHPAEPEVFSTSLTGCHVSTWERRGKYLLGNLRRGSQSGGCWGVHLRMTGQFRWIASDVPSCPHTRVRFWNVQGNELRFVDTRSFGQMWWVPPQVPAEEIITGLQRLGPEPFSENFNSSYLKQKLQTTRRPIKSALLDQSLVAGVGNIYADEALFTAGIAPQTPAAQLEQSQLEKLQRALVQVLENSIGAGGTTFSDFRDLKGSNGNYGGVALVYRRAGEPCRQCGTTIQRQKLSGRSSHWCPSCQL